MVKRLTTEIAVKPFADAVKRGKKHSYQILALPQRRRAETDIQIVDQVQVEPASIELSPEQVIQEIVFSLRPSPVSLSFSNASLKSFPERRMSTSSYTEPKKRRLTVRAHETGTV